ncbi:uncharacterized protein TNCV_3718021 [Trichonephila clavipes]|nr:uncharacterized protein TNCV_3718021 [Trichonephila clavipes]
MVGHSSTNILKQIEKLNLERYHQQMALTLFYQRGKWCSGVPLRSLCPRSFRKEEIGGLGIPLCSLWSTLHCRRVAGVSPLLSIGWWYLSSVSPKRHCCRVSAADKRCRVYPLDPRPDAVALYSGCTPGKRHAWCSPDDRHTASLVGLRGGWRHARTKLCYAPMDPVLLCPVKGLVLPNSDNDTIATRTIFLILSLPNTEMYTKSPLAINKALIGIGGEPKSVKRLRSGDLLIETLTALRTKSFLLEKMFLNSPTLISPYKYLNSCRSMSVCIDYSQSHPSESKLCPKWKIEKQIQEIKTNKKSSCVEARKLLVPQKSQTYAQYIALNAYSLHIILINSGTTNAFHIFCPNYIAIRISTTSIPLTNSAPAISISLSTPATSSSSTPSVILSSTSDRVGNLSTEIQPPVPLLDTSLTTSPGQPSIPKVVKNSKRRRKRTKEQKPDIEVKMSPLKPNKSYVHYTSEDEDMIVYDVKEDEHFKHIKTGYIYILASHNTKQISKEIIKNDRDLCF